MGEMYQMEPLISVIVPVYNIEKFIIPCLESLKVQTFNQFEVIVVNDGSKDNCAEIIESFINRNQLNNFFLYTKENGGLSSARNYGMKKARGEWVFFLDGDDWVEPECLKILAESALNHTPDLVLGGYQAVDDITGKKEIWSNYPKEYGLIPQDFDGIHSFGFCWGRLYKKSIIDKYNLTFDTRVLYAEDNAWQFDYNQHVKSYSCSNEILCNYRINREGASTGKLVTPQMKYFIWEHMEKFIEAFSEKDLEFALKTNPGFNRVFWRVISTAITNDILEHKITEAKAKRKMHLTKIASETFNAQSQKDKFFVLIFKKSFFLLRVFIYIYYNNFEKLRKSKFLNKISKVD